MDLSVKSSRAAFRILSDICSFQEWNNISLRSEVPTPVPLELGWLPYKLSLSAIRAPQASYFSSQSDYILPADMSTKPCNTPSCLTVSTSSEKFCAFIKSHTPLSLLWPPFNYQLTISLLSGKVTAGLTVQGFI